MRSVVLVLGVALVLVSGCGGRDVPKPRGAPVSLVLPALDGGEIDVAAYRGQIVVLHVFASWSMHATGDVEQLAEADHRDDVIVIGVATDPEGRTVVAPWRRALSVHYLVGLADDRVRAGQSALGDVSAIPLTIVLDARGRIARRIDRQLAAGELAAVIDEVVRSAR